MSRHIAPEEQPTVSRADEIFGSDERDLDEYTAAVRDVRTPARSVRDIFGLTPEDEVARPARRSPSDPAAVLGPLADELVGGPSGLDEEQLPIVDVDADRLAELERERDDALRAVAEARDDSDAAARDGARAVEALQVQLDEAQAVAATAQAELEAARRELAANRAELAAQRSAAEGAAGAVQAEVATARAEVDELRATLAEVQAQTNRLAAEGARRQALLDDASRELVAAGTQADALVQAAHAQAGALLEQARRASTDARAETEEVRSELARSAETVETLRAEVDGLQRRLAAAQELAESTAGQRDAAMERQVLRQGQMERLSEAIAATRELTERLHSRVRDLP